MDDKRVGFDPLMCACGVQYRPLIVDHYLWVFPHENLTIVTSEKLLIPHWWIQPLSMWNYNNINVHH